MTQDFLSKKFVSKNPNNKIKLSLSNLYMI